MANYFIIKDRPNLAELSKELLQFDCLELQASNNVENIPKIIEEFSPDKLINLLKEM